MMSIDPRVLDWLTQPATRPSADERLVVIKLIEQFMLDGRILRREAWGFKASKADKI